MVSKGEVPWERDGVENGSPFQYSCLENSIDKGDWQATVHGVAESDTTACAHMHA